MFIALIQRLRKLYWFVFRPHTTGVKSLICYQDEVLLIRNTYGTNTWTLPGGGVKRGEIPQAAIVREVLEEVGIEVGEWKELGTYESTLEYKRDTIYCFSLKVASREFHLLGKEVAEAEWFNVSKLPRDISSSVTKAIDFMGRQ
jgi:8-oxo-dGTP pyrophosphatase MutT (NUDIX family)